MTTGHPAPGRGPFRGHQFAGVLLLAITLWLRPTAVDAQALELPTLAIDAPASLEGVADELRRSPLEPLSTAMALAGLTHPGPPINVLLIAEGSELARSTPTWISGFADGARSLVVLFPDRARGYPTDSLDTLLHHEVAHVLFSRAARGQPVPRWFNEGLAMAAERPVGLGDRSRLAWTLVRHGNLRLDELEALFGRSRGESQRAYAVAGALVRDLIRAYGNESPGRVLGEIGHGTSFESAFQATTGAPIDWAVDRFWRRQRSWIQWLPFLTGPAVLWMVITLLALLAIWVHRHRRAARRDAWDEEERLEREQAEEARLRAQRLAHERLLEADTTASGSAYDVH